MSDVCRRIVIEINPVGWKAPTAYVVRRGPKMSAAMAPAPEVRAYQEAVRDEALRMWRDGAGNLIPPITVPCRIDMWFARRLDTYTGPSGRLVVKHRQDSTNLRKSTEDALQKVVVKNDVLVVGGWTWIVAQDRDVEHPYVALAVHPHTDNELCGTREALFMHGEWPIISEHPTRQGLSP